MRQSVVVSQVQPATYEGSCSNYVACLYSSREQQKETTAGSNSRAKANLRIGPSVFKFAHSRNAGGKRGRGSIGTGEDIPEGVVFYSAVAVLSKQPGREDESPIVEQFRPFSGQGFLRQISV